MGLSTATSVRYVQNQTSLYVLTFPEARRVHTEHTVFIQIFIFSNRFLFAGNVLQLLGKLSG